MYSVYLNMLLVRLGFHGYAMFLISFYINIDDIDQFYIPQVWSNVKIKMKVLSRIHAISCFRMVIP